MSDNSAELMQAIDREDIKFLRDYLDLDPDLLDTKLSWGGGYQGFALHYAAFKNKPAVIEFLVAEKNAAPDRSRDVGSDWTPLHHAKEARAYAAAAMLLDLGANPNLPDSGGTTVADFARSDTVKKLRDPAFPEKLKLRQQEERQRRIAGSWTRTGEQEVVHDYELPDSRQRLTDAFNFETRIWRATAKDMDGKGMAQSIIFFDDMPDRTILGGALEKLRELGGHAVDSAIDGARLGKKPLKPGLPGQG